MKEIIIDGEKIHTRRELHSAFADSLSFPEWYGANLDALHDCLGDIREAVLIRFVHFDALNDTLPLYAQMTVRAVRHACRENPCLCCTVEGQMEDDEE